MRAITNDTRQLVSGQSPECSGCLLKSMEQSINNIKKIKCNKIK